jgi:hypothetical protein
MWSQVVLPQSMGTEDEGPVDLGLKNSHDLGTEANTSSAL